MVGPNNNPNYFERVLRHKHALLFAGGVATAIVAKKVLESKVVKDATTDAVASLMAIRKDAEDRIEEIRADAEAMIEEDTKEDTKEEKVEIEVEEEEEKPKKSSKKSKTSKKSKK